VWGSEDLLRQEFIARLRSALVPPALEAVNYHRLRGDEVDLHWALSLCRTPTFSGDRRLVILSRPAFLGTSGEEEMLPYLEDPSPFACLCLEAGEGGIDKRRKLYRRFSDCGTVVECQPLRGAALERWMKNRLARWGKDLTREAAELLSGREAPMTLIDQDLHKLAAYSGQRESITAADVQDLIPQLRRADIFALVDSVGRGDGAEAVTMLGRMRRAGAPALMILGMIARQIRLIRQVKFLLDGGSGYSAISKELGLPPFVVRKCAAQAEGFTQETLSRYLQAILETDVGIKSGRWDDRLALERLVALLTGREDPA